MADTKPVESAHIPTKMDEVSTNSEKQGTVDTDKATFKSEGPQIYSNIIAPSKLDCTDQNIIKCNEPSRSTLRTSNVLRPPQLNGNIGNNVSSSKTFLLNPSRLNPFTKILYDENNEKEDSKDGKSDSNSAPKFLPLLQNGSKSEPAVKSITPTASTSAASQSNDFIFGQNIQDRVVSDNKVLDAKLTSCSATNGTSDMLFSNALKETNADSSTVPKTPCNKSLSESAREYEESRAIKRKYEEVEIKTGEEGETNVLQITCKLFAFDKPTGGNWQERGRGTLRLNDLQAEDSTSTAHSRLVFRTSGSLRVVLNTKIWAEMTVQQASDKSIRLTAFDSNGDIKVFLLTGSPEDIKHLQKHLQERVKKELEKQKSQRATVSSTTEIPSEPETKKLANDSKADN